MEYILKRQRRSNNASEKARVVPPRPTSQLRKGGGRKDSPGWTEHKRKANRDRLNALRAWIQTAVTVTYPSGATPEQLSCFNDCHRNFCKEHKVPARCVWEGPGPHHHIALGITHDHDLESKWRARVGKLWLAVFEQQMPVEKFLWKPEVNPDCIASYLSKTRDKTSRKIVKKAYDWLTFCPVWETGFRGLIKASAESSNLSVTTQPNARKKRVALASFETPEKKGDSISPHYTGPTSEKGSDSSQVQCETSGRGLFLLTLTIHFPTCSLMQGTLFQALQIHGQQKLPN